jgi:hypothetical protein
VPEEVNPLPARRETASLTTSTNQTRWRFIYSRHGAHFFQEGSPGAVGEATARFVAKALPGRIARAA